MPYSDLMRWRQRLHAKEPMLKRPGPAKVEEPDIEKLIDDILGLAFHEKRTGGTGALLEKYAEQVPRRELQEIVTPDSTRPYYAEINTNINTNELTQMTVQVSELREDYIDVRTINKVGLAISGMYVTSESKDFRLGLIGDGTTDSNGVARIRAVNRGLLELTARGGVMQE